MKNQLQTPHSGYHWNNKAEHFFEGWYFRVTLPQQQESFSFMYSIQNPMGGKSYSGGAVQMLGVNNEYLCRIFPNPQQFWSNKHALELVYWRKTSLKISPQLLHPQTFAKQIQEGYQATATIHQGCIRDPGTGKSCQWYYKVEPVYGWGNPQRPQKATAGWLSYLPIFDPGWQVLTAYGLASGWIEWLNQRYELSQVPFYSEKNWGYSFPQKWFWINCNCFKNESDLALTAVGSTRRQLDKIESVGLIGLHYGGQFYEFTSLNSQLRWNVQPWGQWEIQASNQEYTIAILGQTEQSGTFVRVPTEQGLRFNCRDTLTGNCTLELRDRLGNKILQVSSNLCGLEIGGSPWDNPWNYPLTPNPYSL